MSLGPQCGKPCVVAGVDTICVDVLKGKNRIVMVIKKGCSSIFFSLYLALFASCVSFVFLFLFGFLHSLAFHPDANLFVIIVSSCCF